MDVFEKVRTADPAHEAINRETLLSQKTEHLGADNGDEVTVDMDYDLPDDV